MTNKNKTSSRTFLSLRWAPLLIVLVKTHIDNPFQWKRPSNLLEKVKKTQDIIDNFLVSKYWGIKAVFLIADFCPWRFFYRSFKTIGAICDDIQTTLQKTFRSKCDINFLKSHFLLIAVFLGISLSLFWGLLLVFICSNDIYTLYWFISIN